MERDLPNKINIQQTYEEYRPVFQEILSKIEASLKKNIHISSAPTYKNRIKSFNSYYKKILRQKPKESAESKTLVTLTDMMGIRVICAFLEDIDIVEKQLEEAYDVKEIERKGSEQSFREFGYESRHVLIAIPEDCMPEDKSVFLPPDLVCEIQIRTILQDAWAEVEHELIYKSEFNPFDKPLRRKLASINASLSLADTIFQEIRDYQNRLVSELGCRRNTFYDKADELTDKELGTSRENAMSSPVMSASANKAGSIDDLVLQALHEHNVGNFMQAVLIYTQILESKPEPPDVVKAVILKHRGMAYFAQNQYDSALSDFQESEKHDPKGFRTIYYEGIVHSVQGHETEAIECYNRSLGIDPYQSHVYYRRAISYFMLGDYNTAMKDITSSEKLGLNDDDLKALKSKVIKKFDMGM
ncbi:MAG: tetratricopeptide repeat protein [Treponema sp.]|nr:tetratricopeptide repeat protein [Treponema sp.]